MIELTSRELDIVREQCSTCIYWSDEDGCHNTDINPHPVEDCYAYETIQK